MAIETPPTKKPLEKPNKSCWRVGGITCLTLLILTIALSYFLYVKFSKTPAFKNVYSNVNQMSQCMPRLAEISGALSRYKQKNGAYPEKLADLYPTFLEDKSYLHCPADQSPIDNLSYTYKKPDKNTQSSDIVVSCTRHEILKTTAELAILKNGNIVPITIPPGQNSTPVRGKEMNPDSFRK
ncbi:MAG: hypothetical protein ACYC0V_01975 [Armatimonadota bacterium]